MQTKRILAVGKVHEDFISFHMSPPPQEDEDVTEHDDGAFIDSELQDLMDYMEDLDWLRGGC